MDPICLLMSFPASTAFSSKQSPLQSYSISLEQGMHHHLRWALIRKHWNLAWNIQTFCDWPHNSSHFVTDPTSHGSHFVTTPLFCFNFNSLWPLRTVMITQYMGGTVLQTTRPKMTKIPQGACLHVFSEITVWFGKIFGSENIQSVSILIYNSAPAPTSFFYLEAGKIISNDALLPYLLSCLGWLRKFATVLLLRTVLLLCLGLQGSLTSFVLCLGQKINTLGQILGNLNDNLNWSRKEGGGGEYHDAMLQYFYPVGL